MLHKLFLASIALVAVLATASKAQAWVGPAWGGVPWAVQLTPFFAFFPSCRIDVLMKKSRFD